MGKIWMVDMGTVVLLSFRVRVDMAARYVSHVCMSACLYVSMIVSRISICVVLFQMIVFCSQFQA